MATEAVRGRIRGGGPGPVGDRVRAAFPKQVFTDGDALYRDMLRAIEAARHRVCLQTRVFRDDTVGRRFISALCERAEQGVSVQVLVDAIGSLGALSRRRERAVRGAGVRLRRRYGWSWQRPWRVTRGDHRRLLVVDHRVAYTGGFDIEAAGSRCAAGAARRRDLHVRFEGALARDAEGQFDHAWHGTPLGPGTAVPGATDTLLPVETSLAAHRLIGLRDACAAAAHWRLWLWTPCARPPRRWREALVAAAGRGVDTRLLMPAGGPPGVAGIVADRLVRAGVRVFHQAGYAARVESWVSDDGAVLVAPAGSHGLPADGLALASIDPALNRSLARALEAAFADASERTVAPPRPRRSWLAGRSGGGRRPGAV